MAPAYHVAGSYARPVVGTVAALFRYPVKSMLGEQLDSAELGERGLAGDRAHAIVDLEDGRIASAKHPRKWSRLLELRAAYRDGPGSPVVISFPDGATATTADTDIDQRLSSFLGRDVTLASQANEGQVTRLRELAPSANFDVRRYRPNVLVDTGGTINLGDAVDQLPSL